ncbi:VanZ family protein [Virgibacillus necropolis]|uniref:VanZ family protein n=1 Tax=Virgibacillus necropolis TaxID=163877 RepID=UPI003850452F
MGFFIVSWVILIFILTCTNNVYQTLIGEFDFVITPRPYRETDFFTFISTVSEISKLEFVGHFILFFILSGLLIIACKRIVGPVVIAFLIGITIEFFQPYFGRGADFYDVLANGLGIFLCVVLYGMVRLWNRPLPFK